MGKQFGYKKYMKKDAQKEENGLLKIFIISFFGMLLVFTFLIKSFSPTVDTSIGDYQEEDVTFDQQEETKKIVDNRLEMIQNEDQGRNFSELMAHPDDTVKRKEPAVSDVVESAQTDEITIETPRRRKSCSMCITSGRRRDNYLRKRGNRPERPVCCSPRNY